MRYERSLELLNNTHDFPTQMMFKVIGVNEATFVARVVAAVRDETGAAIDPPFRTRQTVSGRHISVTLEPDIEDAQQVLDVYQRLRTLHGVVMLF